MLVTLSFGLMLLGKADNFIVDQSRIIITEAATPVMRILSVPASKFIKIFDNIKEIASLREENSRLKKENEILKKWQFAARELKSENQQLSNLLNYNPPDEVKYKTARIIAEKGGAFDHSFVAYLGDNNRVKKGEAVINGDGLVGRIDLVGMKAAKILPITDINSKVPVVVEKTRVRAIVAGNNTSVLNLTSLARKEVVNEGDVLVTSGIAGAFPKGTPAGDVSDESDPGVQGKAFADLNRLEYIRIVDYDLRGILPSNVTCETQGR
jgi:rod shape-determining protein MreC